MTAADAVAVVALTDDQRVVLARQFRPGPDRLLDELPGGELNDGETPLHAALRELFEETGYVGDVTVLAHTWQGANIARRQWAACATNCRKIGQPSLDPSEEFCETVTVSLTEFRDQLRSGQLTDGWAAYVALDHLGLLAGSPLRPQQQRGRRARRDPTRDGRHQVAEHECTERDGDDRDRCHGRAGHDVDRVGEEVPQEPPEHDPQGHADRQPDDHGDARLPGDARRQLPPGEAECPQHRHGPPPAPDRGDEGQPQCGDRTHRQPKAEDQRGDPHRPIVDDLGRSLHRVDRTRIVGGQRHLCRDAVQGSQCRPCVRSGLEADEDGVRPARREVELVAHRRGKELVGHDRTRPHGRVARHPPGPDRGHGGRADDAEPMGGGSPVADRDVSPTFSWSWASVPAPRTICPAASNPWPVRIGGATAAPGDPPSTGTVQPVDVHVAEPVAGPGRHAGVVVQERGRLRGGDVAGPPAGDEGVVPVPAVEAGVGHERVEAGAEHDGGDDDDHGQRRRRGWPSAPARPRSPLQVRGRNGYR